MSDEAEKTTRVGRATFGDVEISAHLHASGTNMLGIMRSTGEDARPYMAVDLQLPPGSYRVLIDMLLTMAEGGAPMGSEGPTAKGES